MKYWVIIKTWKIFTDSRTFLGAFGSWARNFAFETRPPGRICVTTGWLTTNPITFTKRFLVTSRMLLQRIVLVSRGSFWQRGFSVCSRILCQIFWSWWTRSTATITICPNLKVIFSAIFLDAGPISLTRRMRFIIWARSDSFITSTTTTIEIL